MARKTADQKEKEHILNQTMKRIAVKKRSDMFEVLGMLFIAVFFGALIISLIGSYHTSERMTNLTIEGKERITVSTSEGNTSSKYLIFTDREVFENTDSLLRLKFNSSDFYGRIKVGQTCDFTVIGWRIPFFSVYRNIIEYECR